MPSKLLLADDSITIQRVIELTFADEDVDVTAVGDGRQAIERIQSDAPDIVLADVGMPEQDGYEVASFVKGDPRFAQIPVLLLAGAFEPVDEARARAVGCDGVLIKPFEPQVVISRVRELLAQARTAPAKPAPPPVEPLKVSAHAATTSSRPQALDAYFERLDAAFAAMSKDTAVPEAGQLTDAAAAVATTPAWTPQIVTNSGDVLGAPAATLTATAPEATGGPSLSEAFAAILNAEQGSAPATLAVAAPDIPDEVIDEIARRVIARMGDDVMRKAVLDAAERLVREEIERIKRAQPARP